jgi:hypothetical protein
VNELEWKIRDVLIQKLGDYVLLGVEETWAYSSREQSAKRAFKEITETAEAVMKLLRFKQGEDNATGTQGRQDQRSNEETVREG